VNARDAMPDGGTLLIETRNTDLDEAYSEQHADVRPGPYVELKVSDTGSGMSKETLSHLFEPFFTTKKAGEGTGLGLATVYGIVKQAGGSIWVYSESGKGTSFKIYLPRVDAGVAGTLDVKIPMEGLRGTETILLAEDQQQLLKMASGILQRYGYTVIEATNPQQALVEAERYQGEIHLLLTDIVMPQMTGVELATCLKVSRPGIQSIFMSGYSERVVPERRDIKGSYLTKPFSPDELVEKVRETLGAPKSTGVILVVDDEAGIRKLLRSMLTGAGFQVLEAESGKQAVIMTQSANVDLVIIDLAMPEQEGFETMTLLRTAHPRLKIIAMSGRFAGPLLRAAEVLGAQASIAKPIKQDELLALVARVMGERR
jgi:CheY-like chemotaxis protein